MDTSFEAWRIVYRRIILAIHPLEGKEDSWSTSALISLFPSEADLRVWLAEVCNEVTDTLLKVVSERSAIPPFAVSDDEIKVITFRRLVVVVHDYLRTYAPSEAKASPPKPQRGDQSPAPPSAPAAPAGRPSGPMTPGETASQPQREQDRIERDWVFRDQEWTDIFGRDRDQIDRERLGYKEPEGEPKFYSSFPVGNCSLVQVFYATDRMEKRTTKKVQYEHHRSSPLKVSYGICTVSIPKTHTTGKLETPSILRLEFRPNPRKHVILRDLVTLEEKLFLERVASSVSASSSKEAFIFIHGYNVTFEDAARRTAQIAFDLHFVGAPILFSWPSNGHLEDYLKDETNIAWSTPHFGRFLELIAQYSGAERIHIIAHSMGNRAVCDALKALSLPASKAIRLTHVVLAAPDIDADTFRELYEAMQIVCKSVTLYQSSKDKALQASKLIHGSPRAGEPILVMPKLETIDASAIDTDFLSHSYFSNNWPLLSDIFSLFSKDTPAGGRFGLDQRECPEGKYYAFRPN